MVALSAVMTLAAGGYLLFTANGNKDQDLASKDISLHYAAESGMQMGVRWMRCHWKEYFDPTWAESQIITQFGDFETLDGFQVKVTITGNPTAPHIPLRTLVCLATRGYGEDTLKIAWQMDATPTDDVVGASTHCKPVMSNWQETLYPGKP